MDRKKQQDEPLDKELEGGLIAFVQRFSNDEACRSYLEARRWPNGPICPHCGVKGEAFQLKGKTTRPGLWKCRACRKPFSVTIGTIFEGSHVPLHKWFAAIYLMGASKKGMSAHQLHRGLGITYKSMWFVCHRIREAMKTQAFRNRLAGKVEVDETYIGARKPGKHGRGAEGKAIVLGIVERGGEIKAQRVPDVKKRTIQPLIRDTVEEGSAVFTDELLTYRGLGAYYSHGVVCHAQGQMTKGDIHINSAEGFFALLKRGIHGTFHHVGHDKLDMYCGEFGFRYNTRKLTDGERFTEAVTHTDGRLRWFFNRP